MKYGILREHCKKQKEDRIKQLCRGKLPRIYRRRLPDRLNYAKRKGSLKKNIGKQLLKRMAATAGMFSLISLGIWFLRGIETLLNLSFYLVIGAAAAEVFTILAVIFLGKKRKETGGYRETDKKYQG